MKKNYMKLITLLLSILALGCSSKEKIQNEQYLRCNKTSFGVMSEVEDGYFYIDDQVLFYADKSDLSKWVPVCNKPDCTHSDMNVCNAYMQLSDYCIQKNEKFYGITYELFEGIYVYEIDKAGSGRKKVYTVPGTDNITGRMGGSTAIFSDYIVVSYLYLDENGLTQRKVLSVEMDEKGEFITKKILESDSESADVMQGNAYWKIRGDKDLVMTNFQLEEGEMFINNVFHVTDGLEKVNIPEDVSLLWGYFNEDTFTYYKQNEGFYEVNWNTGEKRLLFTSQIENAKGYVLSEDYMLECNRYIDYQPEEAYLRFYNGEKWTDIELPEEVKNSNDPFYPVGIASDRIFFNHNRNKGDEYNLVTTLYSINLKEEKKELVYCGEVGLNAGLQGEEETVEETEIGTSSSKEFEEVVVLDTEDIFLKITDVYLNYRNYYCIDMYAENKSDKTLTIFGNHCAINGVQCNPCWGDDVFAGQEATMTMEIDEIMLADYNLKELYSFEEYTDIEICFFIIANYKEKYKESYVHIYPQGEDNVITFEREPQSTDQVLVDDENISVIVTGYDTGYVPGDTIHVVIQNKTDQQVMFKVEEALANGFKFDLDERVQHQGLYYVRVNPGKYTVYPMTLFDDSLGRWNKHPNDSFFTSNGIKSVEEIEMVLRVYPISAYGEVLGEDILNKTFVLYPNVKE